MRTITGLFGVGVCVLAFGSAQGQERSLPPAASGSAPTIVAPFADSTPTTHAHIDRNPQPPQAKRFRAVDRDGLAAWKQAIEADHTLVTPRPDATGDRR